MFAEAAGVGRLAPFHHDPTHSDTELDEWFNSVAELPFDVVPAAEGMTVGV